MLKKNVLAVSFCTLLLVSLFQFLFVFEVQWTGRDLVCKAPSTNCQHSVNDLLLTSVRKAELATKSTCKKDTYRPSGKEKGAWLLFFFFFLQQITMYSYLKRKKTSSTKFVHQLAFSFY